MAISVGVFIEMKIKKIEQVENEDVYNMEVENHHNFAVNGGFIVHNCDALRYFCIMRQRATVETTPNYVVGGSYSRGELKLKGFKDYQINLMDKNGQIKLIGK